MPSSKNGGYDDGSYNDQCVRIQKEIISAGIDDYMKNEFAVHNYDYLLYAVANRSLDLTIGQLGRDRVEKEVKEYRRLYALANEMCANEAIFPCSSNGTLQRDKSMKSCYGGDQGCGYKCVNRVIEEEEEEEETQ